MHADAFRMVLAWLPQIDRLNMLLTGPVDAPWRTTLIEATPWEWWRGTTLAHAFEELSLSEFAAVAARTVTIHAMPRMLLPKLAVFSALVDLNLKGIHPSTPSMLAAMPHLRTLYVGQLNAPVSWFHPFSLPPGLVRVHLPSELVLKVHRPPARLTCLTLQIRHREHDTHICALWALLGRWTTLETVEIQTSHRLETVLLPTIPEVRVVGATAAVIAAQTCATITCGRPPNTITVQRPTRQVHFIHGELFADKHINVNSAIPDLEIVRTFL